eukprot:Gb_40193 [translate_table: standard]
MKIMNPNAASFAYNESPRAMIAKLHCCLISLLARSRCHRCLTTPYNLYRPAR